MCDEKHVEIQLDSYGARETDYKGYRGKKLNITEEYRQKDVKTHP